MRRHWKAILIAIGVVAFFAAMLIPALQPAKVSGWPAKQFNPGDGHDADY